MKSLGYVHTPITEHHRWSPYSRRSIATGRGGYNRATRLLLHQMRWRKPPRQYGLMLAAALLSILVHLVWLVSMLLVRPPVVPEPPAPLGQENAIQVRFIDSRPPPSPPPIPALPTPPQPAPHTAQQPASPPARAPRRAPLPIPPRVRPEMRVEVPPTQVAVVTPAVAPAKIPAISATPQPTPVAPAQPVKPEQQPQPALPPVALPPPKLVLEPSKMALPPPKVRLTETAPVTTTTSTQATLQPVAPPPPRIQPQLPQAAKIELPTASIAPAQVAEVKAPPSAAPLPAIPSAASVPITQAPLQPAPAVSVRLAIQPATVASVTPAPAASQVLPAAPLSAPQVQIAGIQAPPGITVQGPKPEAVPRVPSVRVTPSPAPAQSTPAPARVVSVTPPPAAADWAQQSDTFSKQPVEQPGHGTAERRQAGKGSPEGVPAYVQRQPQGNSDVMTRQYRGFHYKRTIFDQYWAPDNQGLLTSLLQRLVDALSFHKTFDLGHGVRIHCGGWLLGFGCGGGPPQPMSKMSNDRRLNMAPAKPLVPGLGSPVVVPPPAPPPSSSEESVKCETARVAGGPLPPGCAAAKGALGGWKQRH